MKKLLSVLRTLRGLNCTMAAAAVWVGWAVENGKLIPHDPYPVVILSMATFLGAGGSNTLNDMGDVHIDRKGKPNRPLVKGDITWKDANGLFLVLWGSSLILGAAASLLIMRTLPMVLFFTTFLLILIYEKKLKTKGLPGNFIVSVLTGIPFVLGASLDGPSLHIFFLATMAASANMSREIMKDIHDMEADGPYRRTYPITKGINNATSLVLIFILLGIFLSLLPIILLPFNPMYLVIVLISDYILFRSYQISKKDPGSAKDLSKTGMLIAMLAFLSLAMI